GTRTATRVLRLSAPIFAGFPLARRKPTSATPASITPNRENQRPSVMVVVVIVIVLVAIIPVALLLVFRQVFVAALVLDVVFDDPLVVVILFLVIPAVIIVVIGIVVAVGATRSGEREQNDRA